jgi:ATPase subunit of ABC transporter with duplicated ATPase domains
VLKCTSPCCCLICGHLAVVVLQVTWPKTLLVVSHARVFLNTVTTDTIHLHSRSPPHTKVRFVPVRRMRAE